MYANYPTIKYHLNLPLFSSLWSSTTGTQLDCQLPSCIKVLFLNESLAVLLLKISSYTYIATYCHTTFCKLLNLIMYSFIPGFLYEEATKSSTITSYLPSASPLSLPMAVARVTLLVTLTGVPGRHRFPIEVDTFLNTDWLPFTLQAHNYYTTGQAKYQYGNNPGSKGPWGTYED